MAELKSGNLTSRSYEAQFKLSHELKDLYYALELGRDLEEPDGLEKQAQRPKKRKVCA